MSRTRIDKDGIEKRQANIRALETAIQKWEMIIQTREHPTFKMLAEKIDLAKKSAETAILAVATNPGDADRDRQSILHMGGQLKLASSILGDFKNSEANIEHARDKIADLKREIEEGRETGILEETATRVR